MDTCAPWLTVLDDVYQYDNVAFKEALCAWSGDLEPSNLPADSQAHYALLDQCRDILHRLENNHLGAESALPKKVKKILQEKSSAIRRRTDTLEHGMSSKQRVVVATFSFICVIASFGIPIAGRDKSLLVQRTATNVRNATLLFDFVGGSLASLDRWSDMFIQRLAVPGPGLLLYSATLRDQKFYHTHIYTILNLVIAAIAVAAAIGKNALALVIERQHTVHILSALRAKEEDADPYAGATEALSDHVKELRAYKAKLAKLRKEFRLSACGRDAYSTFVRELDGLLRLVEVAINRANAKVPNPSWKKKLGVVVAGALVAVTAIVASIHNEATLQQTLVWGVYYVWRLALSTSTSVHTVVDTLHMFCQAGGIVIFLLPTLYRDLLVYGNGAMDDYTRRTIALSVTVGINGTVIHYLGPQGVVLFTLLLRKMQTAARSGRSVDFDDDLELGNSICQTEMRAAVPATIKADPQNIDEKRKRWFRRAQVRNGNWTKSAKDGPDLFRRTSAMYWLLRDVKSPWRRTLLRSRLTKRQ